MKAATLTHGIAFGLFGGLSGAHAPGGLPGSLLGAVIATLGGLALVGVLKGVLGAVNRGRLADAAVVTRSVDDAFLLLLPYALLAALAEGVFGWSAVQAFSAAGLMSAAGLAGGGAIAQGGRPLPNLLLPALLVLPVTAGWMALASLAGGLR
jgi:hypothetical protein